MDNEKDDVKHWPRNTWLQRRRLELLEEETTRGEVARLPPRSSWLRPLVLSDRR